MYRWALGLRPPRAVAYAAGNWVSTYLFETLAFASFGYKPELELLGPVAILVLISSEELPYFLSHWLHHSTTIRA